MTYFFKKLMKIKTFKDMQFVLKIYREMFDLNNINYYFY
jgi:hypothetical protein